MRIKAYVSLFFCVQNECVCACVWSVCVRNICSHPCWLMHFFSSSVSFMIALLIMSSFLFNNFFLFFLTFSKFDFECHLISTEESIPCQGLISGPAGPDPGSAWASPFPSLPTSGDDSATWKNPALWATAYQISNNKTSTAYLRRQLKPLEYWFFFPRVELNFHTWRLFLTPHVRDRKRRTLELELLTFY